MTVFVMLGVFDWKNVQILDEKILVEEVPARRLNMCAKHVKLGLLFQTQDNFHEKIMLTTMLTERLKR